MSESEIHVTEIVKGQGCLRKAALKLSGVQGTFPPVAETLIGTAAHKVMEQLVRDNPDLHDSSNVTELVHEEAVKVSKALDASEDECISGNIYIMIMSKVHAFIARYSEVYKTIEDNYGEIVSVIPEYIMKYQVNGHTLTGTIDLVIETESESFILVDWKTGSGKRRNTSHEKQLQMYMAMYSDINHANVEGGYLVYAGNKTEGSDVIREVGPVTKLDSTHIADEFKDASLLLELGPEVSPSTFPCTVDYMCRYCQYNGGACRGI